jgi:phosphatidylglycerol:prolipoprotein diacylglycerol transferase
VSILALGPIWIAFDPILRLGPIMLSWHGLWGALAVAAAVYVGIQEGKRVGVAADDIYNLAVVGVPTALITARLAHVIDKWDFYANNLGLIPMIQEGGLSIQGGLIGGVAAGIIYCRWRQLEGWHIADVAAPALLIAQAIGRIGCLSNGDAWGSLANLPWSVVYTNIGVGSFMPLQGEPTHPYPAYEILWLLVCFAVLWMVGYRLRPQGSRFLLYVVLYSFGRIFLSLVRQEGAFAFGLQQAQVIGVIGVIAGLVVLGLRMWRTNQARESS